MLLRNLYKLSKTNRNAVFSQNGVLSYKDLYLRSQALGKFLKENHNTNKPIAILGDKQTDVVVSIFAAIYAHKTYVILSEQYPINRLNYLLKDSDADILFDFSNKNYSFDILTYGSKDIDCYLITYKDKEDLICDDKNLDDIATIIYTSGSTGNPKGVELTYENLQKCIYFYNSNSTSKNDVQNEQISRLISMSSFSFGMSLIAFYHLSERGTEVYCAPTSVIANTNRLMSYLLEVNPNGICLTPSLMKSLLKDDRCNINELSNIQYITFGGEMLEVETCIKTFERFPNICLINGYGSTESCASGIGVYTTKKDICKFSGSMPVGLKDNGACYICDENGNIINEDNVIGEIVLYGDNIAKGYRNLDDLTKEKFFYLDNGFRAFKTGDLGLIQDGYIYVVGRKDNQVKVGGNRIELEDVESHLNMCDVVYESAVVVRKDNNDINSMIAAIVLNDEGKKLKNVEAFLSIKKQMKQMVEAYKIPTKIIFVDELPKNISGKLDRVEVNKIVDRG